MFKKAVTLMVAATMTAAIVTPSRPAHAMYALFNSGVHGDATDRDVELARISAWMQTAVIGIGVCTAGAYKHSPSLITLGCLTGLTALAAYILLETDIQNVKDYDALSTDKALTLGFTDAEFTKYHAEFSRVNSLDEQNLVALKKEIASRPDKKMTIAEMTEFLKGKIAEAKATGFISAETIEAVAKIETPNFHQLSASAQ